MTCRFEAMATDYEEVYRAGPNALGDPGREVTRFRNLDRPGLHDLDIGCGQGRDALFIARLGHSVVGVDLSPTGIRDMCKAAQAENLAVTGHAADLRTWTPEGTFDIVLFDRALHMLSCSDQADMAARYASVVRPGGVILILDEAPNIDGIDMAIRSVGSWRNLSRNCGTLILSRA